MKKPKENYRRNPDQLIVRAKELKQKAKGSLSIDEIQKAIAQERL